jgi:tetratricopeptide (TPR) repeat protein
LLARYALVSLVQLHLARGEWEEVSRCLEEGVALAHHSIDLRMWPQLQRLLAERDVLEGCPDAALARLSPLLDHPGTEGIERTLLLPLVAWAHLERGEDAEAAEVVARGIRLAREQNHRLALVDALRVQAMVAIRQERWDEAERSLEEGVALARSMPYPYAEARLLHIYGEVHLQKGEPEPARKRLEAALAIFRRLCARKDTEWVAQAIADLR